MMKLYIQKFCQYDGVFTKKKKKKNWVHDIQSIKALYSLHYLCYLGLRMALSESQVASTVT